MIEVIDGKIVIGTLCHWLAIWDYQPIILSTDKMAASSRFATVNEDDFALKCFFSL